MDTPATATPMTPTTTPPAITLRRRLRRESETPGCAASATSGTTAATARAKPVRPAMLCSLAGTLMEIKRIHVSHHVSLKNRDPFPTCFDDSQTLHTGIRIKAGERNLAKTDTEIKRGIVAIVMAIKRRASTREADVTEYEHQCSPQTREPIATTEFVFLILEMVYHYDENGKLVDLEMN